MPLRRHQQRHRDMRQPRQQLRFLRQRVPAAQRHAGVRPLLLRMHHGYRIHRHHVRQGRRSRHEDRQRCRLPGRADHAVDPGRRNLQLHSRGNPELLHRSLPDRPDDDRFRDLCIKSAGTNTVLARPRVELATHGFSDGEWGSGDDGDHCSEGIRTRRRRRHRGNRRPNADHSRRRSSVSGRIWRRSRRTSR
jgi:hypothetical protein